MLKSYFNIAVRNFSRNKLTTFINVFGLGLSMSVGLMIMIRIQDQFGYDTFHPQGNRVYRITSEYQKKNDVRWKMASTSLPLQAALSKDSNDIEEAVNIYPALNGKGTSEGKEIYIDGAFTQPAFFSVFGFTLAKGNAATALEMPGSLVITKTVAQRFFGGTDILGRVISMESGAKFTVTGVLNDAPGKSHLNYEAYASASSLPQFERELLLPAKSADWFGFNNAYTYVLLKKGMKAASLQTQLDAIAASLNRENKNGTSAFHLQPLNNITPGSDALENDIGGGGSWTKIFIEGGMALLILLAACFNYTNLTIARALTRAKEVGIRKIAGAKRSQVFAQYVFESILLSLLALAFAWLVLFLVVRYAPFNDDYEFIPSSFHYNLVYAGWSVTYAVFTGLLAGLSPAWILSAFRPLQVLKKITTAKWMGRLGLQKSLIVFQYSLSLVLLIFLFVFHRQFTFMSAIDPGFKKDNVMIVPINGTAAGIGMQRLSAVSGVKSVAASSAKFTKHFSGMQAPAWISNKSDAVGINYYFADENFVPQMQLRLTAGSNFPAENAGDPERYVLINEKAATVFGFTNTAKAPGEKIWINDTTQLTVAGVLKDFNYESAGIPVKPLLLRAKTSACTFLYLQTERGDNASMEERVKAALEGLPAQKNFSASWLKNDLDRNNSQSATITLLGFLGFIALAIATLGLLGIVIYTVEVKGKEISIRKVIGASEQQLVKILSAGFIKLLMIAGLIAMPVGWFLATVFLQNFSNRIEFGPVNIAFCFLFLLLIGLFTIVSQTWRAATRNPINSLRNE